MGKCWILGASAVVIVLGSSLAPAAAAQGSDQVEATWTEVLGNAPASKTRWSARAGLQAVTLGKTVYVLGGRVPNPPATPPIPGDSTLLNDVWASKDRGKKWKQLVATGSPKMWSPRAYFASVTQGKYMYVLGGQDYKVVPNPCPPPPIAPDCPPLVSTSAFFNDVWRSKDGKRWQKMTGKAGWAGRAGLSAVSLKGDLYVFGGSVNDDSAVIGGPPVREYFNDVWRSRDDGRTWKKLTGSAPWSKRAGAATVVKGGDMYVLGGEVGFACFEPGCVPPYFNDVWRSSNGKSWKRMTKAAGWSPRPGHKCEVLQGRIVCFGGFGLPINPTDAWWSKTGSKWKVLPGTSWNAATPDLAKYDFDSAVIPGPDGGATYTFGGDRETFDFANPENYLRVDNDVWRLTVKGG
jgi:Kelch motif